MVDFQYELISQYYPIYSPILWLLYFVIVWRIFTRTRESHFLNLIAMNGISDMTLCILGNFFYRWPRNGVFHENMYQKLQNYSSVISFIYFLLFHLPYAEFLSTFFMAFNTFTSIVLPKTYSLFWHDCFYKYVLAFIILPIFPFVNVLLSQSRFHYVPTTQQYLLFTSSLLPQYVYRQTGIVLLTTLLTLTVLLFIFCVTMISMHLLKELDQKLERYQLEEMFIGVLYTGLRAIFLYYELMINSYTEAKDLTAVYNAGNLFPFMNDVITLSPPIFLLIISSQIRNIILPFIGQRKNRVHFDERANEVRNHSGGVNEEDEQKEHIQNIEKVAVNQTEHLPSEIEEGRVNKVESQKPINHESDVQKIVGQSLGDANLYPGYHEIRRLSELSDFEGTNHVHVLHEEETNHTEIAQKEETIEVAHETTEVDVVKKEENNHVEVVQKEEISSLHRGETTERAETPILHNEVKDSS